MNAPETARGDRAFLLAALRTAARIAERILARTPLGERWGLAVRARTGNLFADPERPAVWLHAASLGELNGALRLVRAVDGELPAGFRANLVLSVQTPAAWARLAASPPALAHFDFAPAMLPFEDPQRLAALWRSNRVALAVACESELWPAVCEAARTAGVPLVWWAARLTPKASRRWARLAPGLFARMARSCAAVRAASDSDSARISALAGIRVRRCSEPKRFLSPDLPLFGKERQWELAALSVHAEELPFLLRALALPGAPESWILQTRFPSENRKAAEACVRAGWRTRDWTPGTLPDKGSVALVREFGRTAEICAASRAVFVGGSAAEGIGIHNPLEGIESGCLALGGPYWYLRREEIGVLERNGLWTGLSPDLAAWPPLPPADPARAVRAAEELASGRRAEIRAAARALVRTLRKEEKEKR